MPNGTKLAYHGPSNHADARDWQIIREWAPRSMKLMNYQHSSFDLMRDLYGWLPNTLFVMRDWEMSEQLDAMFARPVETGQAHARDWIAWRDVGRFNNRAWKDIPGFDANRTVCIGINEPTVRGELKRDHPNYAANVQAVVRYTVAFLDTLRAAGMKGGALNYSVGWPDNTGPDTRVNWEDLAPIRDAIQRGGHYLVLHEYFGDGGMTRDLGWNIGRYRQCPWDVKIIIGEGGYDKAVYGGPHVGFGGSFSTEQYIEHLRALDAYYKDDPRVHSVQIFLWDYDDNQWHTFALREIREAFLAYVNSVKSVPDTNRVTTFPTYPAGVVNPLPPAGGGFMIDRRYMGRAGLGENYSRRPVGVGVDGVILHHTGGGFQGSLDWLTNATSGVGAHYLLDKDGSIYQLVEDADAAWHAGYSILNGREDCNRYTLGVEIVNAGDGVDPYPPRQQDALVWLLKEKARQHEFTKSWVDSHKNVRAAYKARYPNATNPDGSPIGYKTDPRGLDMALILDRAFPPPPPPVEPRWDKVVWAMEQAARILQAEGMQREHDVVLSDVSYVDAVRERDN